jgi:hypothetical protein
MKRMTIFISFTISVLLASLSMQAGENGLDRNRVLLPEIDSVSAGAVVNGIDSSSAVQDTAGAGVGIDETTVEDTSAVEEKSYRVTSRNYLLAERKFDVPWQSEAGNIDKFIFRYNRVESIFLGLNREKKYYWDGSKLWNAYGSIGWGFKSHTWRGNLGIVRQFAFISDKGCDMVELGAEIYTLTDTKDQWFISLHENTAASFLIHEDFRNYFERRGTTVHAALYIKRKNLKCELSLSYLADTYGSLKNMVDWSLFGGHKTFRPNPAIDDGNMRSLKFLGGVSTISTTHSGPQGWGVFATAEYSKKTWNSRFDFDQYIVDVRRFQKLGRYENINFRLRAASSDGTLPVQKIYRLGGVGTLNAFPFESEAGNRLLLVNMEFVVSGNILGDIELWPLWMLKNINLLLLTDAGFTRNVSSHTSAVGGFGDMKWTEFRHDFGIAVSNRSGSVRLGFAWRTDCAAPVQLILRFSRPF